VPNTLKLTIKWCHTATERVIAAAKHMDKYSSAIRGIVSELGSIHMHDIFLFSSDQ
jgi:hypothetical protein